VLEVGGRRLEAKMQLQETSPSAVRPVDEPFGHELKAEWLRSSRSGPNGDERKRGFRLEAGGKSVKLEGRLMVSFSLPPST
jgi:hypothetical protein